MAAEVNKPDFSYQWASAGSISSPSDVKIQTGWTAEVPPFQWENYLQNRQDNAILHLFQKGISVWSSTDNYYFTASGERSYVQGSNGLIYVAVADSLNQNPVTDVSNTYWRIAFPPEGRYLRTLVFTTNGTHTPSFYCKTVRATLVGGGGGGGYASPANCGSGGGGGGVSTRESPASGPQSVVVGAGGAGGTSALPATAGGTSSYGGTYAATGGQPGAFNSPAGGTGGQSVNGDINIRGATGQGALTLSGGFFLGGGGGDAPGYGSGTGYVTGTSSSGSGYGSGGSGASNGNNGSNGSNGLVIIVEYS